MQSSPTRRALLGALAGRAQEHVLPDARRTPRDARPRVPLARGSAIRVGIIGLGHMGNGHLDGLLRARDEGAERLDVVAVCDVCRPRRESAAARARERQPGIAVTSHLAHEELLARGDLHAVLIATPEHQHAVHAVDALLAGTDVYVEKPLTRHLDEAVWLAATAQRTDAIVQVGTQYLMHPKFREARRFVAEGVLGTVVASQVAFGRNSREGEWTYEIDPLLAPGPDLDWERWCGPNAVPFDTALFHRWRRYRRWSTGIVGDLLSHIIAPMLHAIDQGLPRRVTAHGAHMVDHAMENHDQIAGHIEFASGHVLSVIGSTCNARGGQWMIRGQQADLFLGSDRGRVAVQDVWKDDVSAPPRARFEEASDDIQQDLRLDWLASVRSRAPNSSPLELGIEHMVVVEMLSRAAWSGRAQRFDAFAFRVFDE